MVCSDGQKPGNFCTAAGRITIWLKPNANPNPDLVMSKLAGWGWSPIRETCEGFTPPLVLIQADTHEKGAAETLEAAKRASQLSGVDFVAPDWRGLGDLLLERYQKGQYQSLDPANKPPSTSGSLGEEV